jgi:type I restriction enzyme M protein
VLTPGRYVGAQLLDEDDEPYEKKIQRLKEELEKQFIESNQLEIKIRQSMKAIGRQI